MLRQSNTLYPEWMEDFKISNISDLYHDKLLVTLRDSNKASSACIGQERDEVVGQGLLHFMGGDPIGAIPSSPHSLLSIATLTSPSPSPFHTCEEEHTNILLDQHMHCVNLNLTSPLQSSATSLASLQQSNGQGHGLRYSCESRPTLPHTQ
jgi:hypothetical protein